jgi:TPR repeat protein
MKTRQLLIVVMLLFASAAPLWGDDHAASVSSLRNRAAQGEASAQLGLGLMYRKGEGVSQDYVQALKWFKLAAAQGEAESQFSLGLMYRKGEGVSQDDTEALKWYRLAAAQGHARAQGNLGAMYADGEGIPQDYVQAHKWFNLAAATSTGKEDRDKAVKARDLVAARMTPAQIAEAQKLAREWKKK